MSIRTVLSLASLLVRILTPVAIALRAQPVTEAEPKLTPEEQVEREDRRACKVAICAAFHNRRAEGGDIACKVTKTWRKQQLEKMASEAKMSWPWGRVRCVADIKLRREMLIKAMSEPKYEAALDPQRVACEVEREKDWADIKLDFTPKVSFEQSKAVKATLNWDHVAAPVLVREAIWTAIATDNTFNVLQGTVVRDINDFIEKKCLEVKDDWLGR